jgi:hypothetical protein
MLMKLQSTETDSTFAIVYVTSAKTREASPTPRRAGPRDHGDDRPPSETSISRARSTTAAGATALTGAASSAGQRSS